MADAWREAISAAERAARDHADPAPAVRAAADLLRDPSGTDPDWAGDLVRLTALLEGLGCHGAVADLVARAAARLTRTPNVRGVYENPLDAARLAVVFMEHSYPAPALSMLVSAGSAGLAPPHTNTPQDSLLALSQTNLAARSLFTGDGLGLAEVVVQGERRLLRGVQDPGLRADVELLSLSVAAEVARQREDTAAVDGLLPALEAAVRGVVAQAGSDHPRSLAALVTLAAVEFQSARGAGSTERMERAAEVLAAAAQRTSATLGAGHPQTASALAHLAAAEAETARALRSPQRLVDARRLVLAAERRLLERRLGCPLDPDLLLQALTHPSYAEEHGTTANERLGMLGDSFLGLVVTEALHRTRPELSEGLAAKQRAQVLNSQALAEVARRLRLGAYLRMGEAEESAGLRDTASELSDALAALVGAVYLDQGHETAAGLVHRLLGERIGVAPGAGTGLPASGGLGSGGLGPGGLGPGGLGPPSPSPLAPAPPPGSYPSRSVWGWTEEDDSLFGDDATDHGRRG